jgi:hypothetical protein
LTCVCLHELVLRACFGELGRQPRKLRKDFVDEAHFGGKIVPMDMQGQESADVAYERDIQSATIALAI